MEGHLRPRALCNCINNDGKFVAANEPEVANPASVNPKAIAGLAL